MTIKLLTVVLVSLHFLGRFALAQYGSDFPASGPDGSFLCNAFLQNNSGSRLLDKDGYFLGKSKALGRVVNPSEVLITAFPWAPDSAVALYTSIPKLPDHIGAIRILYYASKDKKLAMFVGYTIEDTNRKTVATIRYPTPATKFEEKDASAWLKWTLESLASQKPPAPKKP